MSCVCDFFWCMFCWLAVFIISTAMLVITRPSWVLYSHSDVGTNKPSCKLCWWVSHVKCATCTAIQIKMCTTSHKKQNPSRHHDTSFRVRCCLQGQKQLLHKMLHSICGQYRSGQCLQQTKEVNPLKAHVNLLSNKKRGRDKEGVKDQLTDE